MSVATETEVAIKEVKSLDELGPSIQKLLRACPGPTATMFVPRTQLWRSQHINAYFILEAGADPIYFYTNKQALFVVEKHRGWMTRTDYSSSRWVTFNFTDAGKTAWTHLVETVAATNTGKKAKSKGGKKEANHDTI